MTRETLHLVPEAVWDAHDPDVPYVPAAYEADGFVHCTDGDEAMVAVANRFYRDVPGPFLLLTLDLERTGSPWRYDDHARVYPHIYGSIAPRSVVHLRRMERAPDGTFLRVVPR